MADKSVSAQIARRAAQELQEGDVVNLGIGIPTLVADYVPEDLNIHVHTENGMLGVGPSPAEEHADPNLVNAGKLPVSEKIGASYFHSADSFAMIRGGHIDVAILGVLQVDQQGRIANWAIPGQTILGVGGAMDLLIGAKKIIVTTTFTTKKGEPKIVDACTFPITGNRSADLIITELCVFKCEDGRLTLIELMPGATLEQVKANTTANFDISIRGRSE